LAQAIGSRQLVQCPRRTRCLGPPMERAVEPTKPPSRQWDHCCPWLMPTPTAAGRCTPPQTEDFDELDPKTVQGSAVVMTYSNPSFASMPSGAELGRDTSKGSLPRDGTITWNPLPFGSGIVIPDTYTIPTRLLADIFMTIDQRESPVHPGKVKFQTMRDAIVRFHSVIEQGNDKVVQPPVSQALEKLHEQACQRAMRSGSKSILQSLVRWDQGIVFDCFHVQLPRMERIFFTLDISENSTWASRSLSYIMMLAVVLSILTFVLGTLPNAKSAFSHWVPFLDLGCVCIFTLDYFARLLTVPFARMELLDREFLEDVIAGRQERQLLSQSQRVLRFLGSPMGVVDLISVIPFWFELCMGGIKGLVDESETHHSKVLPIFRAVRMFRVFKLGTLAKADLGKDRNMVLLLFKHVIAKAWPALQLVVVLILVALVVLGTLIWYTERGILFQEGDPLCPVAHLCGNGPVRVRQLHDGTWEQSSSPFSSVPASFWWVLVTITTVGYGDFVPITPMGYAVGVLTILYGTVVFALPVGVIGTTFSQQYEQLRAEQDFRRALEEQSESVESGPMVPEGQLRTSVISKPALECNGPPTLVLELRLALQQAAIAAGVPLGISKKWDERLLAISRFENLTQEHPCECLERWGTNVMGMLKEHTADQPLAAKFHAQTLVAWYRLLLRTAEAYEEFQHGQDRSCFDRVLHGQLSTSHSSPRCSAT